MARDAVFLVPGKPPMRGRRAFERGLRAVLKSHRIVSRSKIRELEIAGRLAYCWSALSVRMVPLSGSRPILRKGNALSIFRKQKNGSWLLVRDANLL